MIAAMAISASIYAGTHAYPSGGESEIAKYVSDTVYEQRQFLKRSEFFGRKINQSFEELETVFDECQEENWDGFQALSITKETYDWAKKVIEAIPLGVTGPSIGAEPDGQITLEWYRSPRQVLSVSVTNNGLLHYAALLGTRRAYGTEAFVGDIPKRILNLISETASS